MPKWPPKTSNHPAKRSENEKIKIRQMVSPKPNSQQLNIRCQTVEKNRRTCCWCLRSYLTFCPIQRRDKRPAGAVDGCRRHRWTWPPMNDGCCSADGICCYWSSWNNGPYPFLFLYLDLTLAVSNTMQTSDIDQKCLGVANKHKGRMLQV